MNLIFILLYSFFLVVFSYVMNIRNFYEIFLKFLMYVVLLYLCFFYYFEENEERRKIL